jgi:hypothetical protein
MEVRYKDVKVTFFITGQENKSKAIETGNLFRSTWDNSFSNGNNKNFLTEAKPLGEGKGKNLVLKLLEHDEKSDLYFGYVGIYRDTLLPAVYNKESHNDTNFNLTPEDEVLEKSYFIYYPGNDLLVFHQNHLGPRADDLAFMLFKANDLSRIYFEPIWKKNSVKELLERNSVLRKGSITLALPRNFDEADLDLSHNWGEEIIRMMSKTGMSRMTIDFWGRAGNRKGVVGYLTEGMKLSINELVSKFSVSDRKNSPSVKKAKIQLKEGKDESLLDQELSTKVSIKVENGYPKIVDVKNGLARARTICKSSLAAYIIKDKETA